MLNASWDTIMVNDPRRMLKISLSICNVLPMVWRVTNEPVDCRLSRGTNKHTQDRKRCSLPDDNSTATADYDSAHANYTINYIRQLQITTTYT